MSIERELTNRYLLGTASKVEDEKIGLLIIEDPSFAEELNQAECDLIENYLEGELSAAEDEVFERQYLNSNARRSRVQEIALLKNYATRSIELAAVVEPTSNTFPWYRRMRILIPAFGLLILAIIVSLFFFNGRNTGGVDYASLNRQDLRDPAVIGNSQVVQVKPGTYRSGTSESLTFVSVESNSVLFQLQLGFSAGAGASFSASLERGDDKVFTVAETHVYTQEGLDEVRLLIPRESLFPGVYQIRLVQTESDNAPVLFTFVVR